MPRYLYICEGCENKLEITCSAIAEEELMLCECGSTMVKKPVLPGSIVTQNHTKYIGDRMENISKVNRELENTKKRLEDFKKTFSFGEYKKGT